MRRGSPALLAALLILLAPSAPAILTAGATSAWAATAEPGSLLPRIERQVMCVSCKIPLNVAESPQANREKAFIAGLIGQGQNEAQIKRALVAQYGPTVLGLPGAHGFDLAAYLVPIAVVLALLGVVGLLLPRWRREARTRASSESPQQALDASDAARLDADLARFD